MIRRGFTLLELLVVMAIVGVLAALVIPAASHVLQGSRAAACISNLKQLGAGLNLYLADHKEIMPPLAAGRASISGTEQVIDNTLNAYVADPRVFACPGDMQGIAAHTGTSYFWNSVLSGQSALTMQFFNSKGLSSGIPVLSDKEGFHPYTASKVNILYADGHASQDLQFSVSK